MSSILNLRVTHLFTPPAVIEVASGEYGDLNPVLFEAVQGGLCAEEGKKNSSDKNDPASSCPSQCHNVSGTILKRPLCVMLMFHVDVFMCM